MILQKYSDFQNLISDFVYEKKELSQVIFITFLLRWSLLIEDLPWTWKTTLAKALAKLFGFEFNRIHATSDLVPQDIIGGEYYNMSTKTLEIKKWPIFTQLLLVDEINRMNPKSQSAFLQAMEEKKVSLLGTDFDLSEFFCVIATQNPIEFHGTFVLPEAQKDRFFAKISLGMPSSPLQKQIIRHNISKNINTKIDQLPVLFTTQELTQYYSEIQNIEISDEVAEKMVMFFELLKQDARILYPMSQRWIYIFIWACKANAFLHERKFVIPEDGFELLATFLLHRLDIESEGLLVLEQLYKQAFKHF